MKQFYCPNCGRSNDFYSYTIQENYIVMAAQCKHCLIHVQGGIDTGANFEEASNC